MKKWYFVHRYYRNDAVNFHNQITNTYSMLTSVPVLVKYTAKPCVFALIVNLLMFIIVVFYAGQLRLCKANVQGTLTNKLRAQNLTKT